ncbi:MAG: lipopolysaccharide biosynthesis protein [Armatimonadetes bacterium]|nr:lipopolysaccharide biosynthesis protein [Armatimonadota bacterium]
MRRLAKNSATLFSSNALASVFGLVTLALTSRGLGLAMFGLLQVIQAYSGTVEALLSFKSWQAMVKFGSDDLGNGDVETFRSLIKLGFLLDCGTAVLGAAVVAASVWRVGGLWHWDLATNRLVALSGLVLLSHVSSTPTGILRLFDRFDLLGCTSLVTALCRMVGAAAAFGLHGGLTTYVACWVAAEYTAGAVTLALTARELLRRGHGTFWRSSPRPALDKHAGLPRFLLSTNLDSTVRGVVDKADMLVVGRLGGNEAAGLVKVARQFAGLIGRVLGPVYQAVYPELARLLGSGRRDVFKRLVAGMSRATLVPVAVLFVAAVTVGKWAIAVTTGPAFVAAYPALVWFSLGVCVQAAAFAWPAAILALGRADCLLGVGMVASVVYGAALGRHGGGHRVHGMVVLVRGRLAVGSCQTAIPRAAGRSRAGPDWGRPAAGSVVMTSVPAGLDELLRQEAACYARYLLGVTPPPEMVDRYVAANAVLFAAPPSPADAAVLAFATRHPIALPWLDAAAAVLRPRSRLRRKLVVMLAILEAAPNFAERFLPRHGFALIPIAVAYGLISAIKAGGGVLLLLLLERRHGR